MKEAHVVLGCLQMLKLKEAFHDLLHVKNFYEGQPLHSLLSDFFFARLQGFWEERTVAPGKIDAFLPFTYLHYNLDPTFSPLVMQRVICKAWRSHVGYIGPHKQL